MTDFIWLEYPENGNRWRCPAAAADAWRAKGWQDYDPLPAEPEPAESPKSAGRKRGGEQTITAPEE